MIIIFNCYSKVLFLFLIVWKINNRKSKKGVQFEIMIRLLSLRKIYLYYALNKNVNGFDWIEKRKVIFGVEIQMWTDSVIEVI